ncbi:hypothetical protein RJ55_08729 [Drechmeria coniospora]|nr:hypothetical protein RJ55_08729 [Drechmeria coniospora]
MEESETSSQYFCLFGPSANIEEYVEDNLRRNRELEEQLTIQLEKLDGEVFKKEILEADLHQHKEALIEKTRELHERDQTINTQNCLLGFAWAEAQNMTSAQREKNKTIEQLRGYIEEITKSTSPGRADERVSKKRRLSP